MRKIHITERQFNKMGLPKKVRQNLIPYGDGETCCSDGGIVGGVCESKTPIWKFYRGYNKKFGPWRDNLFWLTDDPSYAKEYGDTVAEVLIDSRRLNSVAMSEIDYEDEFDYYDGPSERQCGELLKNGINCYSFYTNDMDTEITCLWDKNAIVGFRELSKDEMEKIPSYDETNEKLALRERKGDYQLSSASGDLDYSHVVGGDAGTIMESSDDNIETFYRGYNGRLGEKKNHLLWLTTDINYARPYGDTIMEYKVDVGLCNGDLFDLPDYVNYYEGPDAVLAQKLLKKGINSYFFEASNDAETLVLWDEKPIVSRKIITLGKLNESKIITEGLDPNFDLTPYINSFNDFLVREGYPVKPFPQLNLDNTDQSDVMIKTGFYLPGEKSITLFVKDRHPKDILRSYAHEMTHHIQNMEDPNRNWGSGNDLKEDDVLSKIEADAYERGNMLFRKWTEELKKRPDNRLNESAGVKIGTINEGDIDEIWNGDKEEMSFRYPKLNQIPRFLYHASPIKNRESILKNGLVPSVGDEYYDWWSFEGPNGEFDDLSEIPPLVFLTSRPNLWLDCLGGGGYDLYQVNTSKINKQNISFDPTESLALRGSYCYDGVIPPTAIKLVKTIEDDFGNDSQINEATESDVDLSSFKVKDELNPKIWKDGKLDSRVRLALMDIADDFYDTLGVSWVKPDDTIIVGSIANYNWSEFSDIDLHIVIDYDKVDKRRKFVEEFFKCKKKEWNSEHSDIKIFGFSVEVYVQDSKAEVSSSGVYSIDKNEWIKKPVKGTFSKKDIDTAFIKRKTASLMTDIENLEDDSRKSSDSFSDRKIYDRTEKLIDKIMSDRKEKLSATKNEMNPDNIIYKTLRRNGYLNRLFSLNGKTYDKTKSIR